MAFSLKVTGSSLRVTGSSLTGIAVSVKPQSSEQPESRVSQVARSALRSGAGLNRYESGVSWTLRESEVGWPCWQVRRYLRAPKGGDASSLPSSVPATPPLAPSPMELIQRADRDIFSLNREALRGFCQSQRYQYLTVPQDPETLKSSPLEMIGLYAENVEAFTHAVREFVNFCCHVSAKGFIGHASTPLAPLLGKAGNYDQLLLFQLEQEGEKRFCIGLGECKGFVGRMDPRAFLSDLKMLVFLFPDHYATILEEAGKFHGISSEELAVLRQEQAAGARLIKTFYTDHLRFLHRRGISSLREAKMSPINELGLVLAVKRELDRMKGSRSCSAHILFGQHSPLVDRLYKNETLLLMCQGVRKWMAQLCANGPVNDSFSHRTHFYDASIEFQTQYKDCFEKSWGKFLKTVGSLVYRADARHLDNFYRFILETFLDEMQKSGRIAHWSMGRFNTCILLF